MEQEYYIIQNADGLALSYGFKYLPDRIFLATRYITFINDIYRCERFVTKEEAQNLLDELTNREPIWSKIKNCSIKKISISITDIEDE